MLWALCLYFFIVSIFMSAAQTAATAGGVVIFYVAYYFALHIAHDEILQLFGEHHILSVNVLVTIGNIFTGAMQTFNALRRDALDKKIILAFLPLCIISLPFGVALLVYVDIQPIKFVLASLLLCIAFIQALVLLYKPPQEFRTDLEQKHFVALGFTAICSGFLQGAFGIGGPPRMLFMIWSNLCKTRARGPFLLSVYALTVIKLILLLAAGKVHFQSQQQFYILASVILGAIPGIFFGNFVHAHIRPAQLSGFMLAMLIIAATMMFSPPTIVLEIVVASIFAVVLAICGYTYRSAIRSALTRREKSTKDETLAHKV